MADVTVSKLEKKKRQLEEELSKIQNGIDKSIDDVKEGVSTSMEPRNLIKKYPLPLVGASVLVGFLLGKERKSPASVRNSKSRNETGSAISKELKRMLAKKGLSLLMDYLDDKVAELKEHKKAPRD